MGPEGGSEGGRPIVAEPAGAPAFGFLYLLGDGTWRAECSCGARQPRYGWGTGRLPVWPWHDCPHDALDG